MISITREYLFVAQSKDVVVVARVADEAPFKEGDVKYRRVQIDELESEDFEREIVLELDLRPVHLCKREH